MANHRELMRDYFAATLVRLRPLERIDLAEDAEPEAALAALDQAVSGLEEGDWSELPRPDPEIAAVIADRAEELREILGAIQRTTDSQRRYELGRRFKRGVTLAALTIWRLAVTTYKFSAHAVQVGAAIYAIFPTEFALALQQLRSILAGLPWPF